MSLFSLEVLPSNNIQCGVAACPDEEQCGKVSQLCFSGDLRACR